MTIVDALIDLQDVDGRIRELEAELKDLPKRRAQETARLNGVSIDLEAARQQQAYHEKRIKDFEEAQAASEAKIQQLKTTQLGLKSNKEYLDFSIQIENVTKDRDENRARMTAAKDELPKAEDLIARAQKRYDDEKGEVDAFCAEIDARIASVKTELEAAQAERVEKVKAVSDPRFLQYYERLRTKRWPVVVPLTHDGVCDGCHLVQPPSVGQLADANAKNGAAGKPQSIVACTMCGRILYRA